MGRNRCRGEGCVGLRGRNWIQVEAGHLVVGQAGHLSGGFGQKEMTKGRKGATLCPHQFV